MAKDYVEILLNSIYTIVDSQSQKLNNEEIQTGIVVDNSDALNGKYKIQYGNNTCIAESENTEISKNDQVYFQRLKNSNSVIIIGKKLSSTDINLPVADPFTLFGRVLNKPVGSINQGNILTWTIDKPARARYDILAFSADIKNCTNDFKLIFKIVDSSGHLYQKTFISTELFGNTGFSEFFTYRAYLDLSDIIGEIKTINVDLQYNSSFDIQNFFFELGYNLSNLTERGDSLFLYTDSSLEYETDEFGEIKENSDKKTLKLDWVYLDELNNLNSVTSLNPQSIPENAEVRWYRWEPTLPTGDIFSGSYWTYLSDQKNKFLLEVNGFNPSQEEERFKAVIVMADINSGEVTSITSNEISFKNIISPKQEKIYDMVLNLNDGTNGLYPVWNWAGYIKNNTEYYRLRTMFLDYKTELDQSDFYNKIQKLTWKLPEDNMAIVEPDFSEYSDYVDLVFGSENSFTFLTINFIKDKIDKSEEERFKDLLNKCFQLTYQLNDRFIPNTVTNYAIFEIQFSNDNNIYTCEKNLIFDTGGEGGTADAVIVSLLEESTGLLRRNVVCGETVLIDVKAFDANGEYIIPDKIDLEFKDDTYATGKITQSENSIFYYTAPDILPNEFFDILKIKVKISTEAIENGDISTNSLVLVKHVPITLASSRFIGLQGPSEIYYNAAGVLPTFYNINYILYKNRLPIEDNVTWGQIFTDNQPQYIAAYPELKKRPNTEAYFLFPKDYYESQLKYNYSITASIGEEKLYQPIVIEQYNHFSSIIDGWNGKFLINEQDGYVLSSALVAGTKNIENEFSGVVLGTLGTIQNAIENKTDTGLIGYSNGAQSYGFLDDGTAFIGKSGSGQIQFNGNKGVIKSAVAEVQQDGFTNQGMYIDLDEVDNNNEPSGAIHTKYSQITADGKIIGKEVDISGNINAESGTIGKNNTTKWIIGSAEADYDSSNNLINPERAYIYNQKESFNTAGTGVYIGTDGIRLGDGFSVSADGVVTISNPSDDKEQIKMISSIEKYWLETTEKIEPGINDKNWTNENKPELTNNTYVWEKTITNYINGNPETNIICISAKKGEDGDPFLFDEIYSLYAITYNNNQPDESINWYTTIAEAKEKNSEPYLRTLWMKTIYEYNDVVIKESTPEILPSYDLDIENAINSQTTIINGAAITTGTISAAQLNTYAIQSPTYQAHFTSIPGTGGIPTENPPYSYKGLLISLGKDEEDEGIYSPYFALNKNGAAIKGTVIADQGEIGGFTIKDKTLYSNNLFLYGRDDQLLSDGRTKKIEILGATVGATITGTTKIGFSIENGSKTCSIYPPSGTYFDKITDIVYMSGIAGANINYDFVRDENGNKIEAIFTLDSALMADFLYMITYTYIKPAGLAQKLIITNEGELIADSVELTGIINAVNGTIGFGVNKWTIGSENNSSYLYSGNKTSLDSTSTGVYIGTDGISLGASGAFKVTSDGKLNATDAVLEGIVTAEAGAIGSWQIGDIPSSIMGGSTAYTKALYNSTPTNSGVTDEKYVTFLRNGNKGHTAFGVFKTTPTSITPLVEFRNNGTGSVGGWNFFSKGFTNYETEAEIPNSLITYADGVSIKSVIGTNHGFLTQAVSSNRKYHTEILGGQGLFYGNSIGQYYGLTRISDQGLTYGYSNSFPDTINSDYKIKIGDLVTGDGADPDYGIVLYDRQEESVIKMSGNEKTLELASGGAIIIKRNFDSDNYIKITGEKIVKYINGVEAATW